MFKKKQGILLLLSPFPFGTYFKDLTEDLRRVLRKVSSKTNKVSKFSVQLNTR